MRKIFPLPIYVITRMVLKYGISIRGLKNLLPWMIKAVVFEPLRWIELTFNRKIKEHEIKDPIFILGFYRSGTSYLHEFLTQDDRMGYHTNFQMVLPEIMLSSEKILSPFFDFICRVFKIQDKVHRIPMSFKFPGEEDGAMTTGFNIRGAHWGYFFPKIMMSQIQKYIMFENLKSSEINEWSNDFVFLLKKISIANKGRQLVLKSPPNTARVKLLLSLFPNAKFIFIHRNPYETYASNKRFMKLTHKIYALGRTKNIKTRDIILDTYTQFMNKYLSERSLVPDGQLIEIKYEDFIKTPLENMKNIYKTLNLNEFQYCEKKMIGYLKSRKDYKKLEHELQSDEISMVTKRLEPFLKQWNYQLR